MVKILHYLHYEMKNVKNKAQRNSAGILYEARIGKHLALKTALMGSSVLKRFKEQVMQHGGKQ